jgi:hypothetical protein
MVKYLMILDCTRMRQVVKLQSDVIVTNYCKTPMKAQNIGQIQAQLVQIDTFVVIVFV